MPNVSWPWGIVLCRFRDRPAEPRPAGYYVDLFANNGTGGMCDYWRTVSAGALDLTGSRVFGWFQMNRSSDEVLRLSFPQERGTLVQ